MRAAMVVGERRREVRLAARAWEKAGWIDAAGRAEIDRRYVDDRARVGPALRTLICCAAWFAILSGFGTFLAMAQLWNHGSALGMALLIAGVFCVIGAEVAHGPLRTSGVGADDGLELCAGGFLFAGLLLLLDLDHQSSLGVAFGLGALIAAGAAWRWGGWLYGGLACAAGFMALAETPAPRLAWLVVGAGLVLPLLWLGDAARLAPSQRAAVRCAMVVALAALYAALNYASLERNLFEHLWNDSVVGDPMAWSLALAIAATALLPLAVLALGVRRRDRLVIGCGLLLCAASVLTLRWYVHVAPLWLLLLLGGAALGGGALALRRWLHDGPEHERRGFTAEALLDGGRRQLLEMAAAVAAFTPAARAHAEPAGGFEGGGGQSGGGGATTEF